MPPVLIAAIIGAAVTATTTGLELSGVGKPDTPKQVDPSKQPLTATQNAQQTAAVTQQLPNLQSLTGGSLSPEYASQFGALQAGLGNDPKATGNIQEAINRYFGLTAPGDSGLTPGGGGSSGANPLADLLKTPTSSARPPIGGGGGSDWINSTLQGNDFKGLAG